VAADFGASRLTVKGAMLHARQVDSYGNPLATPAARASARTAVHSVQHQAE
jgi:hypothetical protein